MNCGKSRGAHMFLRGYLRSSTQVWETRIKPSTVWKSAIRTESTI